MHVIQNKCIGKTVHEDGENVSYAALGIPMLFYVINIIIYYTIFVSISVVIKSDDCIDEFFAIVGVFLSNHKLMKFVFVLKSISIACV